MGRDRRVREKRESRVSEGGEETMRGEIEEESVRER